MSRTLVLATLILVATVAAPLTVLSTTPAVAQEAAPPVGVQKPAPPEAQKSAADLTEVELLRIEVLRLQSTVADQQMTIAQLQATLSMVERQRLQDARRTLESTVLASRPGMQLDWSTGRLTPAPAPVLAPKK